MYMLVGVQHWLRLLIIYRNAVRRLITYCQVTTIDVGYKALITWLEEAHLPKKNNNEQYS